MLALGPTSVAQEALGWPSAIDAADERTDLDPREPAREPPPELPREPPREPAPEPDDDPTMIRPSPLPAHLTARRVDDVEPRPSLRRFSASLGGQVGKYQLRAKLGRGSFGVVFTASDPSLEREVAIKVLRPSHLTNPEIVQRFLQEARATARIAHPGIVTIHDCGRVETSAGVTAFIAMELLTGESLALRLARSLRFAPDAAIEIARQVASALEAAHRADVLHRDLKPDNIHLVPDPAMPEGERIKVLDFGLAKLGHGGHTSADTVFGTPRYMSPEQCRSSTLVDHRGDIYALGCILFELVTGRPPFDGDLRHLIECHQRRAAPRAGSVVADLPAGLDDLIAEMLAKDPMSRPQTMGAVQRALSEIASAAATSTGPAAEPVTDRVLEIITDGATSSIPLAMPAAPVAYGRPLRAEPAPASPAMAPASHAPRASVPSLIYPPAAVGVSAALAALDHSEPHALPGPARTEASSGVVLIPASEVAALAPAAPSLVRRILVGLLCVAIMAAGAGIALLVMT